MQFDPDRVIQELLEGNQRFVSGETIKCSRESLKKFKNFAETGQKPKAIVLCCSDSRAPVEMIFDQDVGDLFVIRVAGNIIAPSLVGSVEFAATTFGTKLVIVMGHSQCGAIEATLNYIENAGTVSSENIHDIVRRIKPHIHEIAQMPALSHDEKSSLAVKVNVQASVSQLEHSSRLIEGLILKEKIRIVGAVLDLSTGKVAFI